MNVTIKQADPNEIKYCQENYDHAKNRYNLQNLIYIKAKNELKIAKMHKLREEVSLMEHRHELQECFDKLEQARCPKYVPVE